MIRQLTLLSCIFILLATSGCSWLRGLDSTGGDADYRRSTTLPPLEVPPDLTYTTDEQLQIPQKGEAATYSEFGKTEQQTVITGQPNVVLPESNKVELMRDGDKRWLVVDGNIEAVWKKVQSFWETSGLELSRIEPQIGIMETAWLENRADIPNDSLRSLLGKIGDFIYSAPTRDKFRTRLERGAQDGSTEVYLTHTGVEEIQLNEDQFEWRSRPSNPELEAEMLNRLLVFLGVDKAKADTMTAEKTLEPKPERATLSLSDSSAALTVHEDYEQAWRLTGLALDKIGFTVEDRNRERGLYYVKYRDPESRGEKRGFFSRIFGKKEVEEDYIVQLKPVDGETRLTILDKYEEPESSKTAQRILTLLHEELT
ncbi:outer membrane protein assembly factor BamC [Candidatus Albibeggiatoa sp. nov. NOAA]|uniref:outer membrane protein assembly factor BamC n=1 Tax=Candidatus Albibeggiatoa sp. nov. NOAA TaxID=3162724 RepID=UPI0032F9750A|nr:outer membrane protein assembly factor BamC [Thiotrichaceae bacterium]